MIDTDAVEPGRWTWEPMGGDDSPWYTLNVVGLDVACLQTSPPYLPGKRFCWVPAFGHGATMKHRALVVMSGDGVRVGAVFAPGEYVAALYPDEAVWAELAGRWLPRLYLRGNISIRLPPLPDPMPAWEVAA
jgi:hypothetical protein